MKPEQIRQVFAKADQALAEGKVTKEERDRILIHYYGTADEQTLHTGSKKEHLVTLLITILMIAMAGFVFNGGITGLITLDVPQQNVTNGSIAITEQVVGLNISGMLYGDGTATVHFDTPDGTFLVAELSSDLGLPRTDRPSYAAGEEVHVEHLPENATYYFDDGNTSILVPVPFNATTNGTLRILTASETFRLPIIIGEAVRAVAFMEECIETCTLAEANGSLRIEATGSAVLELSSVNAAVLAPNTAPYQSAAIGPLTITETMSIDLDQHFDDAEGDTLLYSTSESSIVSASIDGSTLTLTPLSNGTENLTIYVSDLAELVPFTIAITAVQEAENETGNETVPMANETATPERNETEEPVNETAAPTAEPSNTTINMTLDCSGSNPNLLAEECLLQNATEYFPEQDIFWESMDREHVARFTIIGNLLITGDVIEQSTAGPGSRDFSLGYTDRDLNSVPTIWISGGDLHLRGTLYEENANLAPSAGAYSVTTRRGIYLAYADLEHGNLYIRGNVIPYRRSIE